MQSVGPMTGETKNDKAETAAAEAATEAARRRISALWESPITPGSGRPARINRDQIIDAAITIADGEGLTAVSMRSVARALSVGTMTLYSHVENRQQLFDAMIDRAYANAPLPEADRSWRVSLEAYVQSSWELHRRHPWLADVNNWRPPPGPHVYDWQEAGYRALIDSGLAPARIADLLTMINNVILGFVRSAAAEDADTRAGLDYAAYWGSMVDFWDHYFDPERYPTMTRLWMTGGFEAAPTPFETPLAGLLDMVELVVAQERQNSPATIPSFDECMSRYAQSVAHVSAGGSPTDLS